jgi:fructose-specific phosphotransferase system IIA component
MILSKNLKKNNIIIKARSENRWDLIEEMLDLAMKNGSVKRDDRTLLKNALFDREQSMSTGIGKGIAIPHCTTEAIEDLVIVLAISQLGIDFESIDSKPVQIAIFLLIPKSKLKQHIKTLANIARIMNNDELREKIIQTKKPESIIKILKDFESSSDN